MRSTRRTPAAGGPDLLGVNLGRRAALGIMLGSVLGCRATIDGISREPEVDDEVESLSLDLRTPLTREQAGIAPGDVGRIWTAARDTITAALQLPGQLLTVEIPRVYAVASPQGDPHLVQLLYGPVDARALARVACEAADLIAVELAPTDIPDIVAGIAPGSVTLARRNLPGPAIGYLLPELDIRGSTENVATVTIRLVWDPPS